MLTSKGVAGVPRATLVIIAATCASFGLPGEAGVAMLLAVDEIMDMARSATNVMGNAVASVVVARWEGVLRNEGEDEEDAPPASVASPYLTARPATPTSPALPQAIGPVGGTSTVNLSGVRSNTVAQQQQATLLAQIRQTEEVIRALQTQGKTAETQLQVYVQRQQSLAAMLQRMAVSPQLFPSPNSLLDADRLYVLQRLAAWLGQLDRSAVLTERLSKRANETQGAERDRYRLAGICVLWWSNQKLAAIEALEALVKQGNEPIFRLALAQANYSQNNLRESLALLEDLESPSSDLVAEIERLRSEIRRRWSDVARLRDLKGHTHVVRSVAFSPDGKQILSGSYDRTLRIWDAKNGEVRATLTGHADLIMAVAWSPKGELVASAGYDEVRVWNVASGATVRNYTAHAGAVRAVAFSPDGKTLATAGDDKIVRLWNLEAVNEHITLEGRAERIFCLAFSPDGKLLASAGDDRTIGLWDVAGRKLLDTLTGHSKSVSAVAFSPDGATLASGSDDNNVMLWRLPEGKAFATLQRHTDAVFSVCFSPNGKTLASASADRTIKIWNLPVFEKPAGRLPTNPNDYRLDSGASLPNTLLGHGSTVASVTFSPDGLVVASGGYDELIKLWSLIGAPDMTTKTERPRSSDPAPK